MSRFALATGVMLVALALVPSPPSRGGTAPSPLWNGAGALIAHTQNVDPTWLGEEMKAAGFGWLAVAVNTPPDGSWITRFRAAGGLPVGGWSVLGVNPQNDAKVASQEIAKNGLSFYIADAEEPYGYTDRGTTSSTRYARSRVFVASFRKLQPSLPAALTSYCRADKHDLDWSAWVRGAFVFMPQAYVNDFGMAAAPRLCTNAAAKWFPKSAVHPVVGSYAGQLGAVPPLVWAQLLHAAGTTGFSIYPAEAGMSAENWQAFGADIGSYALAARPG